MVAGLPRAGVKLPPSLQAVVAGRSAIPVWENELGGLTFEVGAGSDRCFLKWAPAGSGIELAREAARLSWAISFTPVPRLLETGTDESGSWIVTAALPGLNAVNDHWKANPATAISAIGYGLRALHDALPVEGCPFSWSVEDRLADVHRRASAGKLLPAEWHPIHQSLEVHTALGLLAVVPPIDQLVVCHGDACAPNTLLTQDGCWSGHVDLGSLGIGDRWADLAIATWSLDWNYGLGWDNCLLTAYGIAPDPDRMLYYRLIWDLGP
jgi:kanamycin kinase